MLFKKMLRTLLRYKAQFISMVVMLAIGIGVFAGFSGEWYSIKKDSEYFYNLDGFSDYRITNKLGFTESDLDKVKEIDGVEDATLYLNVETKTKDNDILDIEIDPKKDKKMIDKLCCEYDGSTSRNQRKTSSKRS